MKLTRLILGLAACAGLCACTNDEPAANGVAQETFDGDALYMVVKISDVGTSTRATDGGYQNGSQAEYAVTTADFYFYDAAGVFVSTAEVWDGGEATNNGTGNIEFEGNTVIVLKGLTSVGYPNYMVTVLNQPSDFIPGGTLTEMQTKLADESAVGIMQGTNTYFTMSTSSYDNGLIAPFVTELTAADFYEEPIDLDVVKPVQVYVERLAAKVQVAVSTSLTATTLGDGTTGYKLDETVAGDPNAQDSGSITGDEDIYVKFLGWGLNGTAKHSNIVKNIDTNWSSTTLGFTWSDPEAFRSFWGMSYNYGDSQHTYPTSSNGASSSEGEGKTLDSYLDYISYNDLTLAMGTGYDYCAENTNTVDVLVTKNSSAITNVLIAAELCNEDGNALDLVRYQGELFEKDALLAYALNEEKALGVTVNVYTMDDSTGEEVYSQIDDSYLTLGKSITASNGSIGPLYDGYVVVVADEAAFIDGTYYYNTGETDTDGNPIFAAYTSVAAAIAAVNDVLYAFDTNSDGSAKEMNAFTGGLMYYSVPIEHLNNNYSGDLLEANYGVVRNHWYSLSIDELINVGKGVFDPDEVIIPNQEDEKYYYVGAQINILSWKLVSQSVTL